MKLKGMSRGRGKLGDKDVTAGSAKIGRNWVDEDDEAELEVKGFRDAAKELAEKGQGKSKGGGGGDAKPGSQAQGKGAQEASPQPAAAAPEGQSGEKSAEKSAEKPGGEVGDLLELFREEASQHTELFHPYAAHLQEISVEDLGKDCQDILGRLKSAQPQIRVGKDETVLPE